MTSEEIDVGDKVYLYQSQWGKGEYGRISCDRCANGISEMRVVYVDTGCIPTRVKVRPKDHNHVSPHTCIPSELKPVGGDKEMEWYNAWRNRT